MGLYEELKAIAQALEEAGIPAALVGGLAYSLYVESRATEDLDFLLMPEDWDRCVMALRPLGWRPVAQPMDFPTIRIRRLTKIVEKTLLSCDFLLADDETKAGVQHRYTFKLGNVPVHLAPPEIIIVLKKRRNSQKDLGDIEGLEKLIRGTPDA